MWFAAIAMLGVPLGDPRRLLDRPSDTRTAPCPAAVGFRRRGSFASRADLLAALDELR